MPESSDFARKQVGDVMAQAVVTLRPDDTVREAARRMRDIDAGALPVVDDDDRLVAIVTDRDVVVRATAEGRDADSTRVDAIASRELVTLGPMQSLEDALELMARHQVRRLPVVEEDGRLLGILAQADLASEVEGARVGGLVEEISRPTPAARRTSE